MATVKDWGGNFPPVLELEQVTGYDATAEFTSKGELELTLEIDDYSTFGSRTDDRYVFFSKEEALALADFIYERLGAKKQ